MLKKGATFDATQQYRYLLWREWTPTLPTIGFVMLNPSTADAIADDPTIRRCWQFARAWGGGSLLVANLFAYRATDPQTLQQVSDPVGPDNDDYLREIRARSQHLIVAWGNRGKLFQRDRQALAILSGPAPLFCLGLTQSQQPRHPLYLPKTSQPIPFPRSARP